MSLPELRGTGKLLADPRTGMTRTDKPWTSALIKFQAWKKTDAGWEEGDSIVASCMAFDEPAGILAGFTKGDSVELRGPANLEEWNGQTRLKITVAACRAPVKDKQPVNA